jgi:hypothetical protein
MADDIDWSLTTFEGLRRRQQAEFMALSFREKLQRIEEMNEVVELFAAIRAKRTTSASLPPAPDSADSPAEP